MLCPVYRVGVCSRKKKKKETKPGPSLCLKLDSSNEDRIPFCRLCFLCILSHQMTLIDKEIGKAAPGAQRVE